MTTAMNTPHDRAVRARELGIPFDGIPGEVNAITDVPGLEVGYATIVADEPVVARTGVTAILPRGSAKPGLPCAAGVAVLNGNGELTGRSWIEESGQFQAPIAITNSHAVGAVHRGVDRWLAEHDPVTAAQWMLPVVGETWDGYLNSINADTVLPEHAIAALDAAKGGPLAEGNVGGGTGMNCYGFKGGTGTASRVVTAGGRSWTVGVLLQANFGSRDELRVAGRPLGSGSRAPNPMDTSDWFEREIGAAGRSSPGAGSVIVVVATDAPLLPDQCRALARRVPLGEALRWALIGLDERMSAQRALQIGLVSEVVSREALWDRADQLARIIAAKPPAAIQGTVRAIWESLDSTRTQALRTGLMYPQLGNTIGMPQVDRDSVPRPKPMIR